jgi:hypothetical protein
MLASIGSAFGNSSVKSGWTPATSPAVRIDLDQGIHIGCPPDSPLPVRCTRPTRRMLTDNYTDRFSVPMVTPLVLVDYGYS